jgi:two-component sensor histidine kinase
MDLAIPLGLIINEIVTNSLKYGIQERGVLSILLVKKDELFELHLRDDGPGLNHEQVDGSKKLGLQMVDYLTQQIEGSYEIVPETKGAHVKLTFTNQ